jgi:SulP family sulfate permease
VLVLSIVQEFGYDGLAVATLMAGALLIAMGWARLGAVIRFIPYPVTVGFTTGIALVIAVGQIPEALGLQLAGVEADFLPRLRAFAEARATLDWAAAGLTVLTAGTVLLWPRVTHLVPGPLVALLVATGLTHLLGLGVETVGTRYGGVPSALPSFRLPSVDRAVLPDLFQPALAIALLAGIESLLSAVVADGMTGRRHRANAELVAQGVANLVAPLFGGIPATGAIARTATNVKNGGRTPVAGIVHALTLLLVLTTVGPWVSLVPMAALAGVLLVVAYNMSELEVFGGLLKGPRSDVLVLLTTFALTVLVDLVVAIEVGVVLAALLFMRRMGEVSTIRSITDLTADEEGPGFDAEDVDLVLPDGTEVFEVAGSFFFGSAQRFSEVLSELQTRPRLVILRMRAVFALDSTGLHALEKVHERLKRHGTRLILSGVHAQPLDVLVRSGAYDRLGEDNVLGSFREAAVRAWELLDEERPARDLTAPNAPRTRS